MKLGACNQIRGKVVAVPKGQTAVHVCINIGGGVVTTSSIIADEANISLSRSATRLSR